MEDILLKRGSLCFEFNGAAFPFKLKEIDAITVTDYGDIDVYKELGIITIPMGELTPYADKIFARIQKCLANKNNFITAEKQTIINTDNINGFETYKSGNQFNIDINFSNRKLNVKFNKQLDMNNLANKLYMILKAKEL